MAFVQSRKLDGFGYDWMGPHWVGQVAGTAVFGLLIWLFARRTQARDADDLG